MTLLGAADGERLSRPRSGQQWFAYLTVLVVGLAIAGFAARRAAQPYLGFSLALMLLLFAGWYVHPRLTLYTTVTLSLIGDSATVGWFPMVKNLSSVESIMFVSDAISFSPLELVLGVGIFAMLMRGISTASSPFDLGALGVPLLGFSLLVFVGLGRGLSGGGDFRVAMFEARPLFYVVVLYLLATTLCRTPQHEKTLFAAAILGVAAQSFLSLINFARLDTTTQSEIETFVEHGSTIGMNLVLIATLAALLFRDVPIWWRIGLVLVSIPVSVVYVVSQRRAAIVALAAAVILLGMSLYRRQRRTFWKVAPIFIVLSIGYLGAFWNNTSMAGFGAQAAKSVIAPGDLEGDDLSSNNYRIAENLNVHFTIRDVPELGLGFGKPFYRPYYLPPLKSDFEFSPYLPHNSFLWIWIKTGFIGFATMVYLLGRSIMLGSARLHRVSDGRDALVVASAVCFVAMYSIYTYVDIGWDARNMVLLGVMFAICARPTTFDLPESGADARAQGDERRIESTTSLTTSA